MKSIFAVVFASVYGLTMRLVFGFLNGFVEIMSLSFLFITPLVIGFLTVRFVKTDSLVGAFFKPWITCFIILLITIFFKIEGSICWAMIFPLFAILAGLGGMLAFRLSKNKREPKNTEIIDENEWEQPDKRNLSLLMLFPVLVGLIEGQISKDSQVITISKEIIIPADKSAVWQQLTHINEVEKGENKTFLANAFGFPSHLKTTLDTAAKGGKRKAIYEKGLYFDETIVNYVDQNYMVLDIHTDPDKIPPTVMDEHIVIGGKHLDILQDVYKLESMPGGHSKLTLSSRFSINTPFNWYAAIWADYLMSDILEGELNLIRNRSLSHK